MKLSKELRIIKYLFYQFRCFPNKIFHYLLYKKKKQAKKYQLFDFILKK